MAIGDYSTLDLYLLSKCGIQDLYSSQPDIPRTRSKLLNSHRDEHKALVKKTNSNSITDTHIFTTEVPAHISNKVYEEILEGGMDALAHRLASMDSVMKDSAKRVKCHFNKDALLASFKSKWLPFGWTTYCLIRDQDGVSEAFGRARGSAPDE